MWGLQAGGTNDAGPHLRPALAAAWNHSATGANPVKGGGDPSVGNVYSNAAPATTAAPVHSPPHGASGPAGYGSPIAHAGPPSAAVPYAPIPGMPGMMPPHMMPPQHGAPPAQSPYPPQAQANAEPAEKEDSSEAQAEIARLKREVRKSEERVEFFRHQTIVLQQRLSSADGPIGPIGGSVSTEEVDSLRKENSELKQKVQELQTQNSALRSQVLSQRPLHGDDPVVTSLKERLQELERQIGGGDGAAGGGHHAAGAGGGAAKPSEYATPHGLASPMRNGMDHNALLNASPQPSATLRTPSQMGGDPLDPSVSPGGHARAVIIGCDYAGQVAALRAGVTDAQQWARFLVRVAKLPERDIRLLTDDPSDYQHKPHPQRHVATRDNILAAINWMTADIKPHDQVFFVFCGHGTQVVVEEFAGQKLCENGIVPTDVHADGEHPRVVSDTDLHKVLRHVPAGVQVTLVYDCCHSGQPMDRDGLNFLTAHVNRGRVNYEKLKGHPVLPRFLELGQRPIRPTPPEAAVNSKLRCQAVQWSACGNEQFCVELPIEERPRGVFTYVFISAALKVGVSGSSEALLQEMQSLTQQLQAKWRLQQDVKMCLGGSAVPQQPFHRSS